MEFLSGCRRSFSLLDNLLMRIVDFLTALGDALPLAAKGYAKDAVGLQIGFEKDAKLNTALVAYEITEEVIDEALDLKANLIICYHPLIFPHISSVSESTRTGSLVRKLIKNDIALYVVHTALDSNAEFGTSKLLVDFLGLSDVTVITPLSDVLEKIVVYVPAGSASILKEAMWAAGAGEIGNYDECSFSTVGIGTFRGNAFTNPTVGKPLHQESVEEVRLEMICERWKSPAILEKMFEAHPYEEVAFDRYPMSNAHPEFGMGSIGNWSEPKNYDEVLTLIKSVVGTSVLRHNGLKKSEYSRVACVGGSGMEYYAAAKSKQADVFVTGDIHYHDFHRALHDDILMIDAGHSETERFVIQGMLKACEAACYSLNLRDKRAESLVIASTVSPNVVRYYN